MCFGQLTLHVIASPRKRTYSHGFNELLNVGYIKDDNGTQEDPQKRDIKFKKATTYTSAHISLVYRKIYE